MVENRGHCALIRQITFYFLTHFSFNKYINIPLSMCGTVLGSGDQAKKKTDHSHFPQGTHICVEETGLERGIIVSVTGLLSLFESQVCSQVRGHRFPESILLQDQIEIPLANIRF
jgi:hypothetical protein